MFTTVRKKISSQKNYMEAIDNIDDSNFDGLGPDHPIFAPMQIALLTSFEKKHSHVALQLKYVTFSCISRYMKFSERNRKNVGYWKNISKTLEALYT